MKIWHAVVVVMMVAALAGVPMAFKFEWENPFASQKVAAAKPPFKEHCIGRVVYLQFDNAVVTKLKPDGKVWTCGGA